MLPDEQEALLGDILIYARKILAFTQDISREAFDVNEEKQFTRSKLDHGKAVDLFPRSQVALGNALVRATSLPLPLSFFIE